MKNYLSFGGGVNSVALHLLMIQEKKEFESVFVNHGADWPETYEYFTYFNNWLRSENMQTVTELKPIVKRKKIDKQWNSLVEFCTDRNIIPQQYPRWCTGDWKRGPMYQYVKRPCFMHIGIDAGESDRAALATSRGIENRWLLIEYDIDRKGCKKIISDHGLEIPMKSGCYICPFQKPGQWKELRTKHPDLFCKAENLERKSGRTFHSAKNLQAVIEANQYKLFEQDEYPPCECGL